MSVNLGPMTLAWAILLLWQHVLQCTGAWQIELAQEVDWRRGHLTKDLCSLQAVKLARATQPQAAAAVTTRHERMLPPF